MLKNRGNKLYAQKHYEDAAAWSVAKSFIPSFHPVLTRFIPIGTF